MYVFLLLLFLFFVHYTYTYYLLGHQGQCHCLLAHNLCMTVANTSCLVFRTSKMKVLSPWNPHLKLVGQGQSGSSRFFVCFFIALVWVTVRDCWVFCIRTWSWFWVNSLLQEIAVAKPNRITCWCSLHVGVFGLILFHWKAPGSDS